MQNMRFSLFPALFLLCGLAAPAQADSSFHDALQAESGHAIMPGMPEIKGDKAPGSAVAMVSKSELKIEKATGENSHTVAEIFEKTKALHGKTARVRGKVVKVSRMIMGKNWVHLQDGTGATGQHDLVATTTEEANVGAIVTVSGTVAADRDFGAGYRYAALLENAHIETEPAEPTQK